MRAFLIWQLRDFLNDMLAFLIWQAQKTFCEKAERDGLSTKIVAMLTAECAGLYLETKLRIDEVWHQSYVSRPLGLCISAIRTMYLGF